MIYDMFISNVDSILIFRPFLSTVSKESMQSADFIGEWTLKKQLWKLDWRQPLHGDPQMMSVVWHRVIYCGLLYYAISSVLSD